MKKISPIALAIGLLGTAFVVNAADVLSENITATATVSAPAKLSAEYTPGAPLSSDDTISKSIGKIVLSGYKGTPAVTDLKLTDAGNRPGELQLMGEGDNWIGVNAYINQQLITVNTGAGTATGNIPENGVTIDLVTPARPQVVPAGEYTDNVTITLSNQ